MKKIAKIFQSEFFWLGLILIIAAFLRLYKLQEWQYFNYDQARDYLIIKRIIVDHKLTLIGPTVLAPGIFLPPFYYYSLVPFLLLSGFHAWGPDFYTAFLGIAALGVFYFLTKNFFKKEICLVLSLIFSLNPYLIHTSRHAWNPNTIYFFTLFFAFGFSQYFFQKKKQGLVIASFSFAWALNLHLTVLVFFPFLLYLFFIEYKKSKISKCLILSLVIFLCLVSPLILFELRHGFSITKAILSFVFGQGIKTPFLSRIVKIFVDMFKMPAVFLSGVFARQNLTADPSNLSLWDKIIFFNLKEKIIFGISLVFVSFSFWSLVLNVVKKNKKAKVIFLFLFFGFCLRLIFPPQSLFFYHYTFLFPFVILSLGYFFEKISSINNRLYYLFFVLAFFPLIFVGLKKPAKQDSYYFLAAKEISFFADKTKKATVLVNYEPYFWYRHGPEYRYALESLYGINVGGYEENDYSSAEILYFIDEGNLENPLKYECMEMKAFSPQRVEKKLVLPDNRKIYLLVK